MRNTFTAVSPRFLAAELFRELQFPRVQRREFSRCTLLPHDDDAATTPKAICEAINQIQLMRLQARIEKLHKSNTGIPTRALETQVLPSTIGRRANMGSIAP